MRRTKAASQSRIRLRPRPVAQATDHEATLPRHLFDDNPVASWVVDGATQRFLMVNDAAVALYGYSRDELLKMTMNEIRWPDERERIANAIRDAGPRPKGFGIWTHRKKEGAPVEVEIVAQTVNFDGDACVIVYARNVTEYRLLERQLRQAQKMEALGLLVGGISHDFNNLLSIITNYTSLALSSVPVGDPLHDDLTEVDSAAKRAAEMTGQLLRFFQGQSSRPAVVDMGDAVTQMERMLRRLLGRTIEIEVRVPPMLGRVWVEPCAIEQIIMNLAVNARDAMPKGGKLAIETCNVGVGNELALQYAVPVGQYVLLSVSDEGTGMDASTQEHLFEALYTTKPPGKGTGLGLCTVAGIVKRAGGFIRVSTAPGAGATFHIYLPAVPQVDPQQDASHVA
jgi:two-component system cell cycle sensor histidine kinase/response regulator CckA